MLKAKKEKTMKNPDGKIATTIYLQPELFAALRQRSLELGSPVAEIVRRACVVYLEADGAIQFSTLQRRMNATYNEARARETAKTGRLSSATQLAKLGL